MVDPAESQLQHTRPRSLAAVRHRFEFVPAAHRAVFPIVKRDSAGKITLYGTGFFVAPCGVFASAKHIFEGDDVLSSDSFEILQEGDGHVKPRRIVDVVLDSESDIAVGMLERPHDDCSSCDAHAVVGIMELAPEVHEVVASFVFSHTLIHGTEPIEGPTGVESYQLVQHRSHWEVGLAEEVYPNGLGFVKGQCFGTSIFVEGRGSGGPVFNSNGFVIGINSRSFAEPMGLPHSTATSIGRLYEIAIGGKTIKELRKGLRNRPIAYRVSLV